MEVMRSAVVKYRTLKPLPGEITSAKITDAALPLKIESARRAIAACTDLPELLKMKDQAEGLAAAVRIMKTVGPEMIRNANCLLADAWRKGGELLSQYSGAITRVPDPNHKPKPTKNGKNAPVKSRMTKGTIVAPSERGIVADGLGLSRAEAMKMVRVANAPVDQVYAATERTNSLDTIVKFLPKSKPRMGNHRTHSDAARPVYRALTTAVYNIRSVDIQLFSKMTPGEHKGIKAKIVEIQELLDTMDRLCK